MRSTCTGIPVHRFPPREPWHNPVGDQSLSLFLWSLFDGLFISQINPDVMIFIYDLRDNWIVKASWQQRGRGTHTSCGTCCQCTCQVRRRVRPPESAVFPSQLCRRLARRPLCSEFSSLRSITQSAVTLRIYGCTCLPGMDRDHGFESSWKEHHICVCNILRKVCFSWKLDTWLFPLITLPLKSVSSIFLSRIPSPGISASSACALCRERAMGGWSARCPRKLRQHPLRLQGRVILWKIHYLLGICVPCSFSLKVLINMKERRGTNSGHTETVSGVQFPTPRLSCLRCKIGESVQPVTSVQRLNISIKCLLQRVGSKL